MASLKRMTKTKSTPSSSKKNSKRPSVRPKAATPKPPLKKRSPRGPISPITGLKVREKIHLPIKGFGRLNGFGVLENLFGKSTAQLKQILEYEEKHQGRRMVIDRINDMLRRSGLK
jgi:hypothetical protein